MNDSTPATLPREFLDAVDRCLSGTGSPEDHALLERHFRETPGALAHYLALAEVEALLPDALGAGDEASPVIRPAPSFWRRHRVVVTSLLAAAACLALAIPVFLTSSDSAAGARLTRTVGARWGEDLRPDARGRIGSGTLTAGFAELTLDSGVRLLVEAPARFDITGNNACRLAYGKAVADVPPSARGFVLDAPGERIIDHGTRFAIDAARDGTSTLVGVLSGEVEVRHAGREVRLFTDYALRRDASGLLSVPFTKGRFATEMPSREFDWSLDGVPIGRRVTLRFDVTRLVSAAGEHRAVFKWLGGRHALRIDSITLSRDGCEVARCDAPGMTGLIERTTNNTPVLTVPAEAFLPGRWELAAEVCADGAGGVADSRGIVTLESGLAVNATEKNFLGRWVYSNDGDTCMREFLPGGVMRMTFNGRPYAGAEGSRYTVDNGILTVRTASEGHLERHMLRDDGTLLFINRPYRNARRE